jgi:hypothetical protein
MWYSRAGLAVLVICTGLMALFAGCGDTGGGPIQVERQEWTSSVGTRGVELLTEHYAIRTTSQDEVLRDALPEFMEAAHREYAKLIPPDPEATGKPMVVYIFGRRPEWVLFTRQFAPGQADTYEHILSGGYMDQATATSVIWDVRRDHTLALLAHEGLHQYLARHRPGPVPAWLNEGLATQFEDFDLVGFRPAFRPQRNLMRKSSLREAVSSENGFIPLERLLAMHAGEAVVSSGQGSRGYYAQVWATVLFLRTAPAYRSGFSRLLADVGTERLRTNINAYRAATPAAGGMSDGEIVFRQYITEELDDFADGFRAYARQLVY